MGAAPPVAKKKRRRFEPWRKLMLAGALVLLAMALLTAFVDDGPPDWLVVVGNGSGYALLAIGFARRMRDRP